MYQLASVALACVLAVVYIILSAEFNRHDAETVRSELAVVAIVGGSYVLLMLVCWIAVGMVL